MDELTRVIRRTGVRLAVLRFVRALVVAVTAAAAAMVALLAAQRVFGFAAPWSQAWLLAGALAFFTAAIWALATWPKRDALARALDEHAGLRESVSTALTVAERPDPWSRATVTYAKEVVQRVRVRSAFPATTPRLWPAPFALALIWAIIYLTVPQGDALGWLAAARERDQVQQSLEQARADVKVIEQNVRAAVAALNDPTLEDELAAELNQPAEASAERTLQTAIRRLTAVQDRLADLRQNERGMKLDAMRQQLSNLRQPGPGPLNDAMRMLQKGDFSGASKALSELAEKLATGQLSEDKANALRDQLEQMARQLEELAQRRNALEDALRKAGLDPKLANDPEAMQKAIEQAPQLSDQQRKQLRDMAQAMQQACEACNGLGGAMKAAADAMNPDGGGPGNGAQFIDGIADMLDELEMIAQEMAAADAAMNMVGQQLLSLGEQCESACQGGSFDMWQVWGSKNSGHNSAPLSSDTDFNTERIKAPTKAQPGPVIGTRLVQGDQVRGESVAEFRETVETASRTAAEAIDDNLIPREHHAAVKRYFGRLERKIETERLDPVPAPDGGQ